MEQFCHLSVDAHQPAIVAVAAQCVGTVNGILIALEGGRCLTLVAVGTAEEIMDTHLLIGSTVTVVISRGLQKQRVDTIGHRDVGAVHAVSSVEQGLHTVAVRLCGTAGERQKNGYDGQQMSHSASHVSYPLFFCQPVI